jgi:hypothetical protein
VARTTTRVKAATVNSRSWNSSMSRFTNFAGLVLRDRAQQRIEPGDDALH